MYVATKTIANIQHPIVLHPTDFVYDDSDDFKTFSFEILKHPRSQRIYAFALSQKDKGKCPLVSSCNEKEDKRRSLSFGARDASITIEKKHEHKPFMYSLKVTTHNKKSLLRITKAIEGIVESQKKLHYIHNLKENVV